MRFEITGGSELSGKVRISGAKNSVLKLMALSLLGDEPSTILNVPEIADVNTMIGVLTSMGAKVKRSDSHSLTVDPSTINNYEAPEALVQEMRASIQVMGPLLTKWGEIKIVLPGGCDIGPRPVDFHLKGFRAMGVDIVEEHGYIYGRAKGLKGADIHLDFPSVGATENIMAAATLADGETIIRNAAREPEIIDQQNFLNLMGAKITGAGTDIIRIEGVKRLKGVTYSVIPDRIEAATYMVVGVMTGGDLEMFPVITEHLESVSSKLREMGARVTYHNDKVRVTCNGEKRSVNVRSLPYPGLPTDVQPQLAAVACLARGASVFVDTIYSNRFKYLEELMRMGANVRLEGRAAIIEGVERLMGAKLVAPDLRGGAALVIAGLAAEGQTVIERISLIDRGYENFEGKLREIGAGIERKV